MAVGLGMPGAILIKFALFAVMNNAVGDLMLMMPITAAGAIFLGPLAAFAGVFLGVTIKAIFKLQ